MINNLMNRLGGEVARPWGKDLAGTAMAVLTSARGYRGGVAVSGPALAFGPATAHGRRPVQGTGAPAIGEITGRGTCDGAVRQTSGLAVLSVTAGWHPTFAEHVRVGVSAFAAEARPTARPAQPLTAAQAQAQVHMSADRHLILGSARDPLPD
ncbi:hypothetical protein [Frankia sp. AgB32]|uniref:hypothetical protein n=1 Tax=Frankia sp. AgB32 TaxID=631119 RepID=UPI00200EAA11|nr:hypothetical protein [Frankia sp. AgB32]MCK9897424.1 hypothetical protein [Frankia sp. AgB32]